MQGALRDGTGGLKEKPPQLDSFWLIWRLKGLSKIILGLATQEGSVQVKGKRLHGGSKVSKYALSESLRWSVRGLKAQRICSQH